MRHARQWFGHSTAVEMVINGVLRTLWLISPSYLPLIQSWVFILHKDKTMIHNPIFRNNPATN